MIRHIKNIGTDSLKGAGIIDLARNTLEGVLSAEKVLTDKYTKGGLLAFMLKLDAHINQIIAPKQKLSKLYWINWKERKMRVIILLR